MIINPNSRLELPRFIDQTFSSPDYPAGLKEFAKSVSSSLEDEEHLLIKAQLGNDGQLGYLIPAAHEAVCHRRRAVVACASDQLKNQLIRRTLPELQKELPVQFTFSTLSTREKYLCVRKYASANEGKVFRATARKRHDRALVYSRTARGRGENTSLIMNPITLILESGPFQRPAIHFE